MGLFDDVLSFAKGAIGGAPSTLTPYQPSPKGGLFDDVLQPNRGAFGLGTAQAIGAPAPISSQDVFPSMSNFIQSNLSNPQILTNPLLGGLSAAKDAINLAFTPVSMPVEQFRQFASGGPQRPIADVFRQSQAGFPEDVGADKFFRALGELGLLNLPAAPGKAALSELRRDIGEAARRALPTLQKVEGAVEGALAAPEAVKVSGIAPGLTETEARLAQHIAKRIPPEQVEKMLVQRGDIFLRPSARFQRTIAGERGAIGFPKPGDFVPFKGQSRKVIGVNPKTQRIVLALEGGRTISVGLNQIQLKEKPPEALSLQRLADVREKGIELIARELRQQAIQLNQERIRLRQAVKRAGGIKPIQAGGLKEELGAIPSQFLRGKGRALDDLATELRSEGFPFESGEDLRQTLIASEGAKIPSIRELRGQAETIITEQGQPLMEALQRPGVGREVVSSLFKQTKLIEKLKQRPTELQLVKRSLAGQGTAFAAGEKAAAKILVSPKQSLARQGMAFAAGEKLGVQEERIASTRQREELVATVRKRIPIRNRGEFLTAVKNVRTEAGLKRVKTRIDERVARINKNESVLELREAFKDINLKQLRPEYRAKIEPIISGIDPIKRTEGKLRQLHNLAEFVEREPENAIPAKRLAQLRILSAVPIKELSIDEVKTITDSVNHLVRLNELKNKLIIKGKLREFDDVRGEAVKNLETKHEQKNGSITGLDSFQMEKEANLGVRIFGADSFNTELNGEILDGMDDGVIQRVFYNEIDEGVNIQLAHKHQAEDFFKERLKGIDTNRWSVHFQKKSDNVDKVTVPLPSGKSITMSKAERIDIINHLKNDDNVTHMIEGGISFRGSPSVIRKLDIEDLQAIAASATPDEHKVADAMFEHVNTLQKDAINKVSVDLLGHEVAVVKNYWRIDTNFLDRFHDELIKTANYSHKTLEGMGIFKERQSAANALIIEDAFLKMYRGIEQVSAYVGLAKPLRSAKALINDNDFQIAVRKAGRNHYLQAIRRYLERIEGDSIKLDNVDRLTQEWINKLDVEILGINPFVMFKQPISFLAASTEMDYKYLAPASKQAVTKEIQDEMRKWHPQLRDRLDGNVTRELGEVAQIGRIRRFFTGKEVISARFMKGIQNFDLKAVGRIWIAAKLQVKDLQPELEGDAFFERVAEVAWRVIRRTQPTFHIKDRSTIGMSRNTFIRLLTKYSSQRNKNYMMYRRAHERYNRSAKTPKDKAELANTWLILAVVSPLILKAINEARGVILGKPRERVLFRHAMDVIDQGVGSVYFLGIAISALIDKIDRGTYAGYDVNLTALDAVETILDTTAEAGRAVRFAITNERYKSGKNRGELKWKTSLKKFMVGAMDTTGKITGIPIRNVRQWLEAGARVVFNKKIKLKVNHKSFGRVNTAGGLFDDILRR